MLSGNNVGFRRSVVDDTGLQAQNQTTSGQSTKKLFKAIEFQGADNESITPEEVLNHFQQALQEGENINEFDEGGFTPLMSIANSYVTSGYGQAALEKMAKLLIQKRSININVQSKQPIYEERQKKDSRGYHKC